MEMMRQTLAVMGVLGLLLGMLWCLRRKGMAQFSLPAGRKGARRLQVIERLALSPQHSLYLVRVSDHTLLLGLSPSGCTVLEKKEGVGAGLEAEALR